MSTKQTTSQDGANTTRYLDKNQAAAALGISTRTLDSWINRRLIPYLKIGRTVRFDPDDLRATLLKQHRVAERSAT
jgi:excisionase family DNA binding protein